VRRLWHRLPWLLVGLVGAMAAALPVSSYEGALEAKVVLAFFVPGVVYMADAVGTQTEALLIRGLSVGVTIRSIARRELATGLLLGAVVAGAFLVFAWLIWDDGRAAAAVSLALLASCSIATVVAMLLPWLLQRLGRDPAFGSGPLATVIQDLLSIAIYFAIATWIAL
jgi:magnesium transporter